MKDILTNRLILVLVTAIASPLGVMLLGAYPDVHRAFCSGGF